jgi:chromosome segregation ATPase
LDLAEVLAGDDVQELMRVIQRRISAAKLRLSQIERALKGRLGKDTRTRLTTEKAELLKQLGGFGDQLRELSTPAQGPDLAMQALDADLIAAQLSGNKDWERSILQYRADIARQRYDQALATPDRADDIETGAALQQALAALEAIKESVDDGNAKLQQQLDLEREKTARLERNVATIGANSQTIMAAFAEVVNGQLGVNLGLGGSQLRSPPGKGGSL